MVGTSWMVAGRTVVAMFVSLLVIATNVILWWALVVFVFYRLSDCSGGIGWAINCSMTTANMVVAVAFAVLLVAPFGWIMLRTVRGLGRWASADH
jgi:hypothetical protein